MLPIVDRKIELGKFVSLFNQSSSQDTTILLLEDNSGQGKTKLLNLYENHCRAQNIPVARIDLKSGSLNPINILNTIRTDYQPLDFPRCNEVVKRPIFTPPTIEISGNKGLGRTNYSLQTNIQHTGLSHEEQTQWWEAGAQAFLDDLSNIHQKKQDRYVLLFDTYEKASIDTQIWLTDHIMRMATPQRIGCLLIVIAGKTVPNSSSEWEHCCQTIHLEPLLLQDWLEYADLVLANIPPESIKRAYARYKNYPLQMATIVNAFAPLEEHPNVG
jgi:hypothetical protein